MKDFRYLIFVILYLAPATGGTQSVNLSHDPFPQLDSIGKSASVGKHFGELYYSFLSGIETQLQNRQPDAQLLVRRFEKVFASFFIEACKAYENQKQITFEEWQSYFSFDNLEPIQYKLLGANAHLNGGLWQAIVNSFTQHEMDLLRKEFSIFKRSLNNTYRQIYHEAIHNNKKIRSLGKISVGIPQWIGNYYLYKWRKRQMKLAKLYWTGSPRFHALQTKVNRKKQKIDLLITTRL